MEQHKPYKEIRKHPPDFKVKYKYIKNSCNQRLFQGIRCDFAYGEDDPKEIIYMIHPEFLDNDEKVIIDKNETINSEGYANMWILMPEMRVEVHQKRIKIGTIGYFVVGLTRIAKLEVVEIIGLFSNPSNENEQ